MPRIEIERKLGSYNAEKRMYGRASTERILLAEVPDEDGTYQTLHGDITLTVLKRSLHGNPLEVKLEGDVLKGTSVKHRQKRTGEKKVSMAYGYGEQTLSKRETVRVILLNANRGQYEEGTQLEMPLGLPVKKRLAW